MATIATENARPVTAEIVGKAIFERPGMHHGTIRTLDQILQTGAPLDVIGGRSVMDQVLQKSVIDSVFGGKEPKSAPPLTIEEQQIKDAYDRVRGSADAVSKAIESNNLDISAGPPFGGNAEQMLLFNTLQQTVMNTPGLREMFIQAIGGPGNVNSARAGAELQKLVKRGLLQDIARGKLNETLILQPDYVGFDELQKKVSAMEAAKTTKTGAVATFEATYVAKITAGIAPKETFTDNRKFVQERIVDSEKHLIDLRKTAITLEAQLTKNEVDLLAVSGKNPAIKDVINFRTDDISKLKMKLDDVNKEINTELTRASKLRDDMATLEADYNFAVQYERLQQEAKTASEALSKGNTELQTARGRILKQALELDGKLQGILPDAAKDFFKKLEVQLDGAYKRSQEDEAQKKIEDAKKEGDIIAAAEGLMIDALTRRYQKPVGKGKRLRYEVDRAKLEEDFAKLTKDGSIAFTKGLIGNGAIGEAFGVGKRVANVVLGRVQDFIKQQNAIGGISTGSATVDNVLGTVLGSLEGVPTEVAQIINDQFRDMAGSAVLPLQVEIYLKQHPEAQQKLVDKVKGKVFSEVTRSAVSNLKLDEKSIRTLSSSDDFFTAAQTAADRMPMVNDLIKTLKKEGLTPRNWKEKMEGTPLGSLMWLLMMVLSLGSKDIFANTNG